MPGVANGVLIPAGTVATASGNSGLILEGSSNPENEVARGVTLLVNVSAASGTTPTLAFTVQAKDPASGNWFALGPASTTITTTGQQVIQLSLGDGTDSAAVTIPVSLPALPWRVAYTIGGTTPSFTFSVGYAYTF